MSLNPVQCRSCRRLVVWCTTAGGKSMPVNLEPVETGNLVMDADTTPPRVRVVSSSPGQRLYISHFATCVAAEAHRRKPEVKRPPAEQGELFEGGR